jgi:hypothetical protein
MLERADNRRVVLIKSVETNNRFYAIVDPERGIRNADTVEAMPDDLVLGIAYPCLEDGLNDFAVIRTTFETIDLFPDDDPIRDEMMAIINDARGNLLRRLHELRDKLGSGQAHFLGTDYDEFKAYALDIVHRGYPRRNLDSMMKLNVFSSVAQVEGQPESQDLLYRFEFHYTILETIQQLPPRQFIVALFEEVIRSVMDDANYTAKYPFDKRVFQKFIAVMFINYATTDPVFYGINRKDYGVSADKEMDDTPLYLAIRRELQQLEQGVKAEGEFEPAPLLPAPLEPDFSLAASFPLGAEPETLSVNERISFEQASELVPSLIINEEVLMAPITSLCSAAALLIRKSDPETQRFARVILADASSVVKELKRLGIISDLTNDPGSCNPG